MTMIHAVQRQPHGKQPMVLLTAAMLGGYVHQLLFYGKDWGVSYPLFILLFYVYFYWSIRERHELKFGAELLLLLPIALLSLTYAAFTNTLFMVLNALAVPCLILMHTTWTVRQKELRWFDPAMVPAVLEQVFVQSLRYIPLPVQTVARAISGRMKTERSQQLWKVAVGIVISLPILLLVGSLLASADAIFEKTLSTLPEWFGEMDFGSILFRLIWIAFVGTGMFIYVWGLLHPKPRVAQPFGSPKKDAELDWKFGLKPQPVDGQNEDREREAAVEPGSESVPIAVSPLGVPRQSTRLDPTIMTTVLVMMNAVYVLFAVVQFSYFFGSGTGVLPDGVTYAEYARRGFAELVIVTVINFTVLMISLYGAGHPERRDPVSAGHHELSNPAPTSTGRMSNRVLLVLLTLLIGCTGVMLSSAHLRLSLYEMAYGFTMTRVLVHAFMMYLLVLFIIALVKLWKGNVPLMKLYLITSVVSYVVLNYVQVDTIIAVNNIERYEQTGKIDMSYLQSLSVEAVPSLIRFEQQHPEVTDAQKALQVMRERLENQEHRSWVEFNGSEHHAQEILRRYYEQKQPLMP